MSGWLGLAGAAVGGLGSYLGAKEQADSQQEMFNYDQKTAAWTQLLGLGTIGQFGDTLEQGNQAMLGAYGNAAGMTGAMPGVAQGGTQAALGQMKGAETGAIQQVLKSQNAALGQTAQQSAASGFGGSIQQGQAAQVYSNSSQAIANVMAQTAGAKAGIIQQGVGQTMQGLLAAAQGQQALGQAQQAATQSQYALMKDKLNTILSTGNAWGVGDWEIKAMQHQAGGLHAAGLQKSAYSLGPGEGVESSAWFKHPYGEGYNAETQFTGQWADWQEYASGFLSGIWD